MRSPLEASYVEHVANLERRLNTDDALRRAVGGEFLAIGKLEYHLLRSRGLRDDHFVVDVGCGSGRLACQLAAFPRLRYIGCDVVPRLLEYAHQLCGRPDWRFARTDGATIPCDDAVADFVCFFSVFTHLLQEDIFRYLREARRVLKPGGLVLMSFLEFRVPSHWAAFIASVDRTREDQHLNQFIERDALQAWAAATGFDVRSIHAGDTDYIPLPEEIVFESGARVSRAASLGQSLAVLRKRETSDAAPPASDPPPAALASNAPPAARPAAPLLNTSVRTHVRAGESVTLGFMIGGDASRRVLVRAVGPTLATFGVPDPLPNPTLSLHTAEKKLAETAATATEAAPIARAVGAFPLSSGEADAALVLTLPPGSYSAVARGTTSADEGEVLIEIYLVD